MYTLDCEPNLSDFNANMKHDFTNALCILLQKENDKARDRNLGIKNLPRRRVKSETKTTHESGDSPKELSSGTVGVSSASCCSVRSMACSW